MVDPPFRGELPRRRPPAGRHPDRPALRPRGVQGVRRVTAVGARGVHPRLRRVGWLLRPPPARQVRRRPREPDQRRRLRPGRLPRPGHRRLTVRRARRGRPHAVRPHLDHAIPRVALPRRAPRRARRRGGHRWWLTERDRHAQNIGQVLGLEQARPGARLRRRPGAASSSRPTARSRSPARRSVDPATARSRRSCKALTAATVPRQQFRPWILDPARGPRSRPTQLPPTLGPGPEPA